MSTTPLITNYISNINGSYQDLGNLYYYWSSNTVNIPSNGVTIKKYSIKYNKPTIILETDITASIDKNPNNGDQLITFGPEVQDCTVIIGNTTNGVAFSPDGISVYGLGTAQVPSNTASSIYWDGIKWFGTVYTTNIISYNGINWDSTGTTTPFVGGTPYGYRTYYNGIIYLMAGSGTTTNMGYSYDGINWTAILGYSCTSINALAWNGTVWLAGSTGIGNTLAYSYNGINWTALGNTAPLPTTNVNAIKWLGDKWIIGGNTVSNSTIAYTRDPTGSSGWTASTSTTNLMTSISAFGWNGQIAVASGYGSNTLAYSTDGITWIPNGKQIHATFGGPSNISWNGRQFLSGGVGGNTLAYSTNGNAFVGLGTGVMTQPYDIAFNTVRKNTITFQRNLTIATGIGASTTIAYSRDGIQWTSYNNTLIGGQSGIAYNGKLWITGTNTTGNSIAFSRDAYTWYPIPSTANIITNISNIIWNGTIFVAVSNTSTTGNTIVYSFDGLTWVPALNSSNLFPGGNALAVAGSLNGVVVGGTFTTSGNTLAYSSNGYNWVGLGNVNSSTTCYGLATNGQMWIAGFNNGMCYSYDGLSWTTCANNPFTGYADSISWNGTIWVAVGSSTTGNAAYSYDGINWSIGTSSFPNSGTSVTWNGTVWVASINSAVNNFAYSYDGVSWIKASSTPFSTGTINIATNNQVPPKPYIQHTNLGFGICLSGSTLLYSMAYSSDGTNWVGLGNSVFSSANCGFWNGTVWVAGGNMPGSGAGNTLGYSYDGYSWYGVGNTALNTACFGTTYNGNTWVAVGQGSNTIAYSLNGIIWTPVASSAQIFAGGYCSGVTWNGVVFLACGQGANALATSYDGVNWTGSSGTLSYASAGINDVLTNGPIWIAALNSSAGLAYTYDTTGLTGWTNVASSPFTIACTGLSYNGIYFVATGTGLNGIAYSQDGVNWISASSVNCNSVCWNGKRFVATILNGNILYSNDGITWYNATYQPGTYTFKGNGIASNSGIGAYVAPSAMVLNGYTVNGNGLTASNSLDIVSSDPYFQTGFTNISINVKTNNIYK
jgi:hypothetical protein